MTRNYTFSGRFWEHQNNNGVVTLVNRMRMGKQTCEKLKAAYEIRVSFEKNHAAALLQMANNLQSCEESGQLGQLLNTTQEQWTLLANAHLETANDLNSNVILPLLTLLTRQKQLRRELQANVTKFYNNRQLQTHCVLRARDRYNAECTKANKIMQQSSGKEKHLTYKRASAVIKKFQQAYDDSMEDLKMVTEEWNKQWQHTCQEFELLEEERMAFLQNNIYTCNDLLSKTLDSSGEAYEKIARAVDLMDVDADLDDFIQNNGGMDTAPDAMDYIKLYVLQEATKSHDNDENQHDATSTTDSVSQVSTTMDDDSYTTLEANDKTSLDTIDSNNTATSLVVGRMEMYNSDDDSFTDSDYDHDGDYDDYGYEHDKPMDDDTAGSRYDGCQQYIGGNDGHQQDNYFEDHDDTASEHLHHQHSKYYYDYDQQQIDLTQHDHDILPAAISGHTETDDGSDMAATTNEIPLEVLGIETAHEKSPQCDSNNDLEYDGEEYTDPSLIQQHKNSGINFLEYTDENRNMINNGTDGKQTVDYTNTDGSRVTADVVNQRPTIVHHQQQNMDTVTKQKSSHRPPSINTQHHPSADRYSMRQQQQTPPPLPEHQYDPTAPVEWTDDNVSMISTPASPSSDRVNEELDNMLRQLEQQTISRPDKATLGLRSLTKKNPSPGRVRLSGVRPRAQKTKPGQKLLKELAGIDTAEAANDDDINDNRNSSSMSDKNVSSSTIVAGSDEWPSSNSLASRKDFFDPFSSLATMSSNSLSIASTTPSAAQVQRQQQKQQKWMLDEVTQAMRQTTNNIKRRPLPERPMDSNLAQLGNHTNS